VVVDGRVSTSIMPSSLNMLAARSRQAFGRTAVTAKGGRFASRLYLLWIAMPATANDRLPVGKKGDGAHAPLRRRAALLWLLLLKRGGVTGRRKRENGVLRGGESGDMAFGKRVYAPNICSVCFRHAPARHLCAVSVSVYSGGYQRNASAFSTGAGGGILDLCHGRA